MALTQNMLNGAYFLAKGRPHKACYEAAGVSERTFYNWLKKDEFNAAVELIKEKNPKPKVTPEEHKADLNSARDDELETLAVQREIVGELGEYTLELIRKLKTEGVEDLTARHLPSLIKSFSDSVGAMQTSNDRLIGLESLIQDVEELEKQIQLRIDAQDGEEDVTQA